MTEALIIGGGMAGPAAAMALQRVGITAQVFDAYDQPADTTGYFLNMASNGLDALHSAGIRIEDRLDGHPIPRMRFVSGTGKFLGEVANGIRLPDGTVSMCVRRGVLQQALREEAAARGLPIRYGKRLVDLTQTGSTVVARFADGSTAEADLLIGADGIHSRTRQLIDPDAPTPHHTGLVGLGGFSRVPGVDPTPGFQHFVFGRRAFFGYLVRHDGEIYWFANIASDQDRKQLAAVTHQQWRAHLLDLFADDFDLISKIIAADTGELAAYPIDDIPTSPTWHTGRVLLIGDAAHATSPSSGQGTSMAFEDAVVLARSLRDTATPADAFATYEAQRRPRVEKVVAYSRRLGGTKTAGPLARRFRDLMMPIGLRFAANEKSMAWLYRYHIDWDTQPVR
jgi:FAD-dependent urate hydroxylase